MARTVCGSGHFIYLVYPSTLYQKLAYNYGMIAHYCRLYVFR